MKKKEELFKAQLAIQLKTHSAFWVNIPDTKMINAENRRRNRESKRPFDGLIIAPKFVLCVELKYGYNQLEPHQRAYGARIEDTNGMYVVLRHVELPLRNAYRAETSTKKQLFECDNIHDFCREIINHFS
jgi:hypothetical protein